MTDTGAPPSTPAGPHPVALLLALELVTRAHLRLTDPRDGRLGPLASKYDLGVAGWTGGRAVFVGLYTPPADPDSAGQDLAVRCQEAQLWGQQRLADQGAEQCDIVLIALGPVAGGLVPPPPSRVRVGAVSVNLDTGSAVALLPTPPGLPGAKEVGRAARTVLEGKPVPTLAAVDLAERQTIAGGYAAPARAALNRQPVATYALIGVFVAVWLLDQILAKSVVFSDGVVGHLYPINYVGGVIADQPGDWWRAISASFLHDPSSPLHVAMNSLAMFMIGPLVEQLYGRLVLLGTFVLAGVAAAVACYVAVPLNLITPGIHVVGASGGLCGLIGLLLVMGRREGKNVPVGFSNAIRSNAATNVVFILIYSFAIPGIAIQAHIGGFIGGALLGLVLPPLHHVGGRVLRRWELSILTLVLAVAAIALMVTAYHVVDILGTLNT